MCGQRGICAYESNPTTIATPTHLLALGHLHPVRRRLLWAAGLYTLLRRNRYRWRTPVVQEGMNDC